MSAYLVAIDPNIGSGHWHSNAQFSLGMSNIYDPSIFIVKRRGFSKYPVDARLKMIARFPSPFH
jgi:hypothetical protein